MWMSKSSSNRTEANGAAPGVTAKPNQIIQFCTCFHSVLKFKPSLSPSMTRIKITGTGSILCCWAVNC